MSATTYNPLSQQELTLVCSQSNNLPFVFSTTSLSLGDYTATAKILSDAVGELRDYSSAENDNGDSINLELETFPISKWKIVWVISAATRLELERGDYRFQIQLTKSTDPTNPLSIVGIFSIIF